MFEYQGDAYMLTDTSLTLLNQVIMADDGPYDVRSFILHAVLSGAEFDPGIAAIIQATISSILNHGLEGTLNVLHEAYVEAGLGAAEDFLSDK